LQGNVGRIAFVVEAFDFVEMEETAMKKRK
jgi:hypothetical protein